MWLFSAMVRAVEAAAAAGPTPQTSTSSSWRSERPASTAWASSGTAHTTSIRMDSNVPGVQYRQATPAPWRPPPDRAARAPTMERRAGTDVLPEQKRVRGD